MYSFIILHLNTDWNDKNNFGRRVYIGGLEEGYSADYHVCFSCVTQPYVKNYTFKNPPNHDPYLIPVC